jgi:quinol monooxygenase YgiN
MDPSEQIVTVAHWQVIPQSLPRVLELVANLREQSLAEPGCLGYEVFSHVGNAESLLLLEHYRDQAALEAHRQSTHYRDLVQQLILPLLATRSVELLRPH